MIAGYCWELLHLFPSTHETVGKCVCACVCVSARVSLVVCVCISAEIFGSFLAGRKFCGKRGAREFTPPICPFFRPASSASSVSEHFWQKLQVRTSTNFSLRGRSAIIRPTTSGCRQPREVRDERGAGESEMIRYEKQWKREGRGASN